VGGKDPENDTDEYPGPRQAPVGGIIDEYNDKIVGPNLKNKIDGIYQVEQIGNRLAGFAGKDDVKKVRSHPKKNGDQDIGIEFSLKGIGIVLSDIISKDQYDDKR
jgi:hypothetical protein